MKKQRGFTLVDGGFALTLLAGAALSVGWVMNIIKFVDLIGGDVTTWFIARSVGIFLAPLGGVMGYF